jgi:TRAP transporter TAXI family solute receptor
MTETNLKYKGGIMFNGRKIIISVLSVLLIATAWAAYAQAPKAISMGTSSMGSPFYALSVVIANAVTKATGINVGVQPSGGSDGTVRGLLANKVEIGMINADTAVEAYNGIGLYTKLGKVPIRLIAQGQDSLRQIVVRADSGIETPADLVGKRFIARRRSNLEIEVIANLLLQEYGIDKKKVKIIETVEANDAVEALKLGSADAALLPAGLNASFLMDLFRSTKMRFLSIPDDKLNAMIKKMGAAWHKSTIPANMYYGQDQPVKTLGVRALIVCRADLPEDMVYKITKAIFSSHNDIAAAHSAGKEWSLQNTVKDEPIPFHSGAIRYFKEVEVWKK